MFLSSLGEVAVWVAVLALAGGGYLLATRRGPRPEAWPVGDEAALPGAMALVTFGVWVFGMIFFPSLLAELAGQDLEAGEPSVVVMHLAQLLARLLSAGIALAMVLALIRPADPLRGRPRLDGRGLLWGLGVYLLFLPLVMRLMLWISGGAEAPQESVRQLEVAEGPLTLLVLFANIALAAPLHEEILFRGLLQGALRRVFPAPVAIAIAAGVFAAMHGPVWLPVLVLGLLLGWLYERSRQLGLAIAVHLAHNLITFVYIKIGAS